MLGRLYDGIEYRGFDQDLVQILADNAGVPVWNGLTDEFHPTQILADILTMREHSSKPLDADLVRVPRRRRATTWATRSWSAARKLGMDVRLVAPKDRWPRRGARRASAAAIADGDGRPDHADRQSVEEGVDGADFLYTDVWVSMGEPKEVWTERIAAAEPLPDQRERRWPRPATRNTKFMHCLPAFHNAETKVGKQMLADHSASPRWRSPTRSSSRRRRSCSTRPRTGCTRSRRSSSRPSATEVPSRCGSSSRWGATRSSSAASR